MALSILAATAAIAASVLASPVPLAQAQPPPPPPSYLYARSEHTNSSLRFVANSSVCETTPGVGQYSGYVDVGANRSMWFWFFEARHDPEHAPFALWLNGGPGCSSMLGLFQENGPCFSDGKTTQLNPYSWNEYANMIYVDQPVGTGFSYGDGNVNTTWQAAPPVWDFFQILFSSDQFKQYKSREFGLWTESYGGHYGPVFSEYFLDQNKKIESGSITGVQVHLTTLGINNGWFDPLIQNMAYYDFAQQQYNGYFDLVNATVMSQVEESLYGAGGCKDLEERCYTTGNDEDCARADKFCIDNVFTPGAGNQDPYYILHNSTDPFPSEAYADFLNLESTKQAIGAVGTYSECPDSAAKRFLPSGDDARSTVAALKAVVERGIRTLIWAGDLDYNCNWLGGYRSISNMAWSQQDAFNAASFRPLQQNGTVYGLVKSVGNLGFVKVFNAGHEVPAYQPIISLELFRQAMRGEPPHSDVPY